MGKNWTDAGIEKGNCLKGLGEKDPCNSPEQTVLKQRWGLTLECSSREKERVKTWLQKRARTEKKDG